MYWWKTEALATKLKNDELGEKDKMQYYLGSELLILIGIYLAYLAPPENNIWLWSELIASIVITIIGVRIAFNSNRGEHGHDFLGRVICLSFPLMIKIIVLAALVTLIAEISGLMNEKGEFKHASIALGLTLTLTILYFWRLNVHLKCINT